MPCSKFGAVVLSCIVLGCLPAAAMAEAASNLSASSGAGLSPVFTRAVDSAMRDFASAIPATPPVAVGTNAADTAPDAGHAQRQALATQLMDLDGTSAAAAAMADKIAPMINMALQSEPNLRSLPAADQAKISEYMSDEFKSYFIPQLLVLVANYYADQFSEDELQTLVATFKTPTMQKYVSVRSSADENMQAQGQTLARDTAMRAMQRYIAWKKAGN